MKHFAHLNALFIPLKKKILRPGDIEFFSARFVSIFA